LIKIYPRRSAIFPLENRATGIFPGKAGKSPFSRFYLFISAKRTVFKIKCVLAFRLIYYKARTVPLFALYLKQFNTKKNSILNKKLARTVPK
jgi:hypothetical protein